MWNSLGVDSKDRIKNRADYFVDGDILHAVFKSRKQLVGERLNDF